METSAERSEKSCFHCGKSFFSEMGLRCHFNAKKACKIKEKLRLQSPGTSNTEDIPHSSNLDNDVDDMEDNDGKNLLHKTTISTTEKQFDTPMELAKAFKFAKSGVGLSINDITLILEVVMHPEFDASKIPFKTGKGCNLWLNKKLSEMGTIEVNCCLYCTLIFIVDPN